MRHPDFRLASDLRSYHGAVDLTGGYLGDRLREVTPHVSEQAPAAIPTLVGKYDRAYVRLADLQAPRRQLGQLAFHVPGMVTIFADALPEVLQLNGICSSFPNYRGVVTKVDVGWALVFEADCHLYA